MPFLQQLEPRLQGVLNYNTVNTVHNTVDDTDRLS
jgi:hypothetical protein